jgi:hypothetical protein
MLLHLPGVGAGCYAAPLPLPDRGRETLEAATFIAMPAVSPFGDKLCKGRQITWGLGCLFLVAATQAGLSFAGVFSLAALMALAVTCATLPHDLRSD